MKRITKISSTILACVMFFTAFCAFVACKNAPNSECEHSLNHTSAVESTCTQYGNIEYWHCDKCNKYFSDSKAKNELAASDILIVVKLHSLNHYTANVATCTKDGNVEYWRCSKCYKAFADENATNEIDISETIVKSEGHVVGSKWESDENGHWKVCALCTQVVDSATHQYENGMCKECGHEDTDKTLTQNEIMAYIKENETLQSYLAGTDGAILGRNAVIKNYFAVDFKVEDGANNLYLLIDYYATSSSSTIVRRLMQIPLTCEMTYENIVYGNFQPTGGSGTKIVISRTSDADSDTIAAILKKTHNVEDLSAFDIITVATSSISDSNFFSANKYTIYLVSESGIRVISIHANNYYTEDGRRIDDPISESILNGTEGVTYFIHEEEGYNYTFSDNVLYDINGL